MTATASSAARNAFQWDDPFLLEDQLSEEERMIRDTAKAYVEDRLAPRVLNAFENETTEPEIFREMGEIGLLGITVPEEYGGVGAGYVSYGLVSREVERCDSGYRSMMSVQSSLVMHPIHAYGIRGAAPEISAQTGLAENGSAASALPSPMPARTPARMKTRAEKTRSRRLCALTGYQDLDLELSHRRCFRHLGQVGCP